MAATSQRKSSGGTKFVKAKIITAENVPNNHYVKKLARVVCLTQKCVTLHTKLHYTNSVGEVCLLHLIVLGNKAHDIAAFCSYTFLGYTPDFEGRNSFWSRCHAKQPMIYTKSLLTIQLAIVS